MHDGRPNVDNSTLHSLVTFASRTFSPLGFLPGFSFGFFVVTLRTNGRAVYEQDGIDSALHAPSHGWHPLYWLKTELPPFGRSRETSGPASPTVKEAHSYYHRNFDCNASLRLRPTLLEFNPARFPAILLRPQERSPLSQLRPSRWRYLLIQASNEFLRAAHSPSPDCGQGLVCS